jgi:hypothetical protein
MTRIAKRSSRALTTVAAVTMASFAFTAPTTSTMMASPPLVIGRGLVGRAVCLSCISGFLALSITGSVAAVAGAVALFPEVATGCGFACIELW